MRAGSALSPVRLGRRAAGLAAAGLVLGPVAAGPAPVAPSAAGFWLTHNHDSVVEIMPCESGLCGRIVGLRSDHAPGEIPRDDHNPDPKLRDTPICGLDLMGGFRPATGGAGWEGGWVYDPESGKTYSAEMRLDGPDTLKLRGYIGVPLFGRSQVWAREPEGPAKNRCQAPGAG